LHAQGKTSVSIFLFYASTAAQAMLTFSVARDREKKLYWPRGIALKIHSSNKHRRWKI